MAAKWNTPKNALILLGTVCVLAIIGAITKEPPVTPPKELVGSYEDVQTSVDQGVVTRVTRTWVFDKSGTVKWEGTGESYLNGQRMLAIPVPTAIGHITKIETDGPLTRVFVKIDSRDQAESIVGEIFEFRYEPPVSKPFRGITWMFSNGGRQVTENWLQRKEGAIFPELPDVPPPQNIEGRYTLQSHTITGQLIIEPLKEGDYLVSIHTTSSNPECVGDLGQSKGFILKKLGNLAVRKQHTDSNKLCNVEIAFGDGGVASIEEFQCEPFHSPSCGFSGKYLKRASETQPVDSLPSTTTARPDGAVTNQTPTASDVKQPSISSGHEVATEKTWAPSFNCSKASTFPEVSICTDSLLGKLDGALSENYRHMLASDIGDGARKDLKATQLKWLAERNKCTDTQCLVNVHRKRIDEICEYPVITGVHPICTGSDEIR